MSETDLRQLPDDDPIDLLERPWMTIEGPEGRSEVSLSQLFERVGAGRPTEPVYVMPHQQHVLHALVVQLMALVCARSDTPRLERTAAEWTVALRALAGGPEAFQLIVDDLSKPAFLQPPVPEGSLERFGQVRSPHELDMLVLAKNHDVKFGRIAHARIEHWVFALISLQTQAGYVGAGNYGVARMNGGFGNRAGLGVASSYDWASPVLRDVAAALEARAKLVSESFPYREDGLALVWLSPWDGTSSLGLEKLDPFFIEVCRRIRFEREAGGLVVRSLASKAARLDAKDRKGNVGDLWMPVNRETGDALTLSGTGFNYDRLSRLLFENEWIPPKALEVRPTDGETPMVIARALVRGQGKTEGFHERVVHLSPRSRSLFASPEGRARLGDLSKHRVETARALRLKVLKPAICAYLQGGGDDLRLDDKRGDPVLATLDARIDAEFFARLFDDVDTAPSEANAGFERWLVGLGEGALETAMSSLPTATARRERAVSAALGRFHGGARKHLPLAFTHQDNPSETQEPTS